MSELQDQLPPGLGGGEIKTKTQQEKTLKLQKNFKLCPQCLDLDIPASKTKFDHSSAWGSSINRNPARKESKKTLSLNTSERDLDNITSENSVQQESRRSRRLALCTRSWRAQRDATACAPDNKTILKARSNCPNINTIGQPINVALPILLQISKKEKFQSHLHGVGYQCQSLFERVFHATDIRRFWFPSFVESENLRFLL